MRINGRDRRCLARTPKTHQVRAEIEGHDGCQGKEGPGLLWEAPKTGTRLGEGSYTEAGWDLI